MFGIKTADGAMAKLAALDRSVAIIEFDLSGRVVEVNDNFLRTVGYAREEVLGRHHRMFVDPAYAASDDYEAFWRELRSGEFKAGQFRRVGKDGRDVWIEASYNPVLSKAGKPERVVKFATDITRQRIQEADTAGQMAAIARSQAVITFTTDGVILDANDNFLSVVGYRIDEIKGRHHSMFIAPEERSSADYADFWKALARGDYRAARYRRFGKDGREIWIQASYNPVLDPMGRPVKVVKFATDITEQIMLLAQLRTIMDDNFGQIEHAVRASSTESEDAVRKTLHVTDSIGSIAAAVEELTASVSEISDGMTRSRIAVDSAFDCAGQATGLTKNLSDATNAMSGIVALIQDVASRINLLALNATIESARAGEAGRGFAIVAQEVKNLAEQARKATEQITVEIGGVQSISSGVVAALGSIQASVEVMREQVVATAAAMAQQKTATQEVSGAMQGAVGSVARISSSLGAISTSVGHVSSAVSETRRAATVLAR